MKKNEILNTVLICIIGVLITIIFVGAIIGVSRRKQQTPEVLISTGKAVNLAAPADSDVVDYYQLGAIRIITTPENNEDSGSAMVVNPWLAYPEGDTVFYEEIARKQGTIKAIFSQYFAEKSQSQILSLGEERITSELIEKINKRLSLGKISKIFFTDFIFL